jgi:uncharacterized protein YybS (DUF2232 family)
MAIRKVVGCECVLFLGFYFIIVFGGNLNKYVGGSVMEIIRVIGLNIEHVTVCTE